MDIYSAAAMKAIDGYAINTLGIPSLSLMETAAQRVIDSTLIHFGSAAGKRCLVFCSGGNNGGDGFAIARLLNGMGAEVVCCFVGRADKLTPDCAEMQSRYRSTGCPALDYDSLIQSCDINSFDFIFDAMFGIGLNSPLREPARSAAELINSASAKVIAVDISSGVESDTGKILGAAVKADLTVTFTAPKVGHVMPPGKLYTGILEIADIGIPAAAVSTQRVFCSLTSENTAALPPRSPDSHKGDFGKLLLVCGSVGFTGAGVMAAEAALRTGAGLVYLGVPEKIYNITAVKTQEAMAFPLDCDSEGRLALSALPELLSRMERASALLIGPGLGRSQELDRLVPALIESCKVPLVLDADGINALSGNIDVLKKTQCPIILTPHAGEFARIGGSADSPLQNAAAFAEEYGCTLVLKGHRTVIASPGETPCINATGNDGMATGGSGDVLSGMITALAGFGMPPHRAAAAGVWLHGRAGDISASRLGHHSMLPRDMLEDLPRAIMEVSGQ